MMRHCHFLRPMSSFLVPKLQGNTIGRQFIYSILDKTAENAPKFIGL